MDDKQENVLRQLFKNDAGGGLSTSYFWYNLVNAAVLVAYVFISWKVASSANPNLEGFAWLTLVVSAVVTGNKIASKAIESRYFGRGGNHEEYNVNINRGNIVGKPTGKKVESVD